MLKPSSCHSRPQQSIRFSAGLFFCAFSLFGGACKSDYQSAARQKAPAANQAARQVKTARVEETPFGETVTANGTLAAFDQSTAGVKVAGRLSSISVDLGSVVRRGQMIV
jgi:HlyD family secretion protein